MFLARVRSDPCGVCTGKSCRSTRFFTACAVSVPAGSGMQSVLIVQSLSASGLTFWGSAMVIDVNSRPLLDWPTVGHVCTSWSPTPWPQPSGPAAQDRSGSAGEPGLTPAHCTGTLHMRRTFELQGSPPRRAGCGSARRPIVSSRRADGCRCPGKDCSGIYSTAVRTRRFTPEDRSFAIG